MRLWLHCHKVWTILYNPVVLCSESILELVELVGLPAFCWAASVNLKLSSYRTNRNIAFKVKYNPAFFMAKDKEELMKGNMRVMLCDWYWAGCHPDSTGRSRMMTDELVCVEGQVIVAERWRVLSVSRRVRRSQSIRAHSNSDVCDKNGCVLAGIAESRLILSYFTTRLVLHDNGWEMWSGGFCISGSNPRFSYLFWALSPSGIWTNLDGNLLLLKLQLFFHHLFPPSSLRNRGATEATDKCSSKSFTTTTPKTTCFQPEPANRT